MKVAIVGAGSVGSALAEGLRRAGHDVVLAVR
ncbi:MAG: NAD(P)-binding domain-containing protein, partial [Actinomycetota bacterium]